VFLGEYAHTIDDKGRMIIPAGFRELLQGGAIITVGFDQNLIVWPIAIYEQIRTRISSMSVTDFNTRLLRRMFFSKAFRVEFDKAGRILIPQPLREAAHLSENAVVTGVDDTLEIWSAELWAEQDLLIQDGKTNAERFAALNLPLR
jgi:MraZ protein